jgi:hypothetical protein
MRAAKALTIIGAISILSSVTAMAEQTPKETPKQSPASQPQANQIDSARTPTDEKSLTEFWTPERLRDARPMPTPSVDPGEVKK